MAKKHGIWYKLLKGLLKDMAIDALNEVASDENMNEMIDAASKEISEKFGIDQSVAKSIAKRVLVRGVDELEKKIEEL